MRHFGALPIQSIREMIEGGFISGASLEHLQPASLDLTISEEMYRVRSVFRPIFGEPITKAMSRSQPERHDMQLPLEVKVTYLVRLNESLALPAMVYGYANPKSSTGRNDIHVRMLADGIERFDSAGRPGYRGELWALVTPRSFRVKLTPNDSLLQIRFFNRDTRFESGDGLEIAYQKHQLLFRGNGEPIAYPEISARNDHGALILTIDLDLDPVGYRCEGSQEVLDLSRKAAYAPDDFFQPIPRPKDDCIVLRRGDFYILATKEYFRLPPELAAEMVPIDIRAGDYRAQYAGFFDPGWGYGPNGVLKGAPAVLEMRPFEDNLTIQDGETICKMTFERMAEIPEAVYGETSSHYLHQRGPRLSKHFKV